MAAQESETLLTLQLLYATVLKLSPRRYMLVFPNTVRGTETECHIKNASLALSTQLLNVKRTQALFALKAPKLGTAIWNCSA